MKKSDLEAQVATTVLVDGNNVMGSRADGWWRNRAEAALRLVDDIAPVARAHGGAWTVVFDGPGGTRRQPHEVVAVVHAGHRRRNAADDRIVELVRALPRPEAALVYTSDAGPSCPSWRSSAHRSRGPGRSLTRSLPCATRCRRKAADLSPNQYLDARSSYRV